MGGSLPPDTAFLVWENGVNTWFVSIRTPRLGALVNRVGHTDGIERWRFGIGALIAQLAR